MTAPPVQSIPRDCSVRVLLADDDAKLRSLLAAALLETGFRVAQAHDGLELLELLVAAEGSDLEPPAAVISDVRMPVYDGLSVLQCARDLGLEVPFLLITDSDDPGLRSEAGRLGAAAFFQKPFELDLLVEEVLTVVAGHA